MAKEIPYLYRKMALMLQEQERHIAIRREMRRQAVFAALCNAIRIRNAERRIVLRELEEMGVLQRSGQRRIRLR